MPSARRLLVLSGIAMALLSATVLWAVLFSVGQIDDRSVGAETARTQVALTSMDPGSSDASIAGTLANIHGFSGARFGDPASLAAGEVALVVPDRPGAVLIWTPRRFGSEMFMQLAPVRLAACLVFLLGIAVLIRRLYMVARELDGRRREAQALAARDALTGLGNRLAFENGIDRMLSDGVGEVAVLYLDLDGFKQVNDTLGHGAGDDVLRMVGRRLTGMTQPADVLVRLGGDEFVLLRPAPGTRDDLATFALGLEAALAEPVVLGTQTLQISVSIGIAVAPADGTDGDALLAAADAALYRAKRDRIGFAIGAAA